MNKLTAGFIGCGAGLLAKAMEDTGIIIKYGIDINGTNLKSFRLNFPDSEIFIKSIEEFKELPKSDIVAITLPCQSFSKANSKRKEEPYLLYYSLFLINKQEPKYWFIENVPNAMNYMPKIADVRLYDMCQFGNKQKRTRMIYSNFNLGTLPKGKHEVPAVTKSGVGNGRVYDSINYETALERMGFKDKGLKLYGTNTQKKEQLGEGVVYEFGYYIGKVINNIEKGILMNEQKTLFNL